MSVKQERLAYLLGALYGDGSFSSKRIFFGATDKEFVQKVANLIDDLFRIKLKIRVQKLSLKNPKWRDYYKLNSKKLYKHLNKYNPKTVEILPKFIKDGNSKVKALFIKGFFDAEGNVDVRSVKRKDGRTDIIRHLKCFSNNVELLQEIKQLLYFLNIKSEIFRGKGKNYYVCIWNYKGLQKFNTNIGFIIQRKQRALNNALNSYKEIQTRWDFQTYDMVLKLRKQKKIGAEKIKRKLLKKNLNIPKPTIEAWIYGRTK